MKKDKDQELIPNQFLVKNGYHKSPNTKEIEDKFDKVFNINQDNSNPENQLSQFEKDKTWNENIFDKDKIETDLDFPGPELKVQLENKKNKK